MGRHIGPKAYALKPTHAQRMLCSCAISHIIRRRFFQNVRGELRMLSGDMLAIMVAVVMSITMCTALGFFVEANRPRD